VGHKKIKHKNTNKADKPINNTPSVSILKIKVTGNELKIGKLILNTLVSKIS
jgi:hypothetical protein